jgi:hypothetical protein
VANDSRTPGKYGALPRDPARYVPTLEHYLRPWEGAIAASATTSGGLGVPLPPAAGDINRESRVTDWPMYGNDAIGDCTIAEKGHQFAAMRVYAGYDEPLFGDEQIVAAYSAVSGYDPATGANDDGADPVTVLQYMSKTGLTDTTGKVHKVAGWAAFGDPRNASLMAQVLNTFGSVSIAFDCTQNFEDAFAAGQPCTWDPASPVVGGHMVCLQRRSVGGIGVLQEITWGAIQRVTRRYNWHQVVDAYAVVSEDWITANGTSISGFDLEQLLADMSDVE